ncbi:MAG: DUF1553 domain-containing protein [Phycisphaerae bacterium]|nr:DUF1553 domain-containing protein [Phycisphaerae bacterium]
MQVPVWLESLGAATIWTKVERMALLPRLMLGGLMLALGSAWMVSTGGEWHGRAVARPSPAAMATQIRYGEDIRPILSDRCFQCHGPDRAKRQADVRLDSFEAATAPRTGGAAIVPGEPDRSAMLVRIHETDADEVMPPTDSGKRPLTDDERALLTRWIEQGAPYEAHWSFVPPATSRNGPSQSSSTSSWGRTPIDRFILDRWQGAGIAPGPEADRATLARRVFLDLTGLPPTDRELAAHLADDRPDAYERLVAMLLEEEPYITRYAERMAVPWLDLARYADTCGIHMDAGRQIWPWRDWVLKAYRSNMPYDRFIIEQLAGDLIPGATQDQVIASGFNRNHVTTDEGGAIPEEYLVEYWVDRTNTTASVFLGLTMGCARCHDHKFDPVSTEDYYSMLAFFNSIEEPGLYSQLPDANRAFEPAMLVSDPQMEAALSGLAEERSRAIAARDEGAVEDRALLDGFLARWRSDDGIAWSRPVVERAESAGGATLTTQDDGSVLASGTNPDVDEHTITLRFPQTGVRLVALEVLTDPSYGDRVGRAPNGNAVLSAISAEAVSLEDPRVRVPVRFMWAWASHEQPNGDFRAINALDAADGRQWALEGHVYGQGRVAYFLTDAPIGFVTGTQLELKLSYKSPYPKHSFGRVRVQVAPADDRVLAQLPIATSDWYLSEAFGSGSRDGALAEHGPGLETRFNRHAQFGNSGWRHAPGVREAQIVGLAQGVGAEYIARQVFAPTARTLDLSLGSDDRLIVWRNGEQVHANDTDRGVAPDQDHLSVALPAGESQLIFKVVNTGGPGGFYARFDRPQTVLDSVDLGLLLPDPSVHDGAVQLARESWRTQHSPNYREAAQRIASIDQRIERTKSQSPQTMVMRELGAPRDTYVLMRGSYTAPDANRKVTRNIPRALGAWPEELPRNRLGLAQWIVSDRNPLTARVTVNRAWELLFGRGLVRTSEDFGVQGELPTHPELLNWLAVEFRDGGWNMRELVRLMVTSSVYRLSSRTRPEVAAFDGDNRLLSWYPRQRLGAEQIRDQALFVGGLLVEELGGRSVKPYQPEGLWQEVAMLQSNTRAYEQGSGDDLWRRSLYTYWKRAVPPPSLLTFDAPTREFCTTRRMSTNTPLQALVLWNDPQFVEAARAAAARVLAEPGSDAVRMRLLFVRATAHEPGPGLLERLLEDLDLFRSRFALSAADAMKLVSVGEHPAGRTLEPAELAAWTMVANAILASDPVIVKD